MSQYLRLTSGGEGEYKEKGSKFIGYSLPLSSGASVQEWLQELRKEHYQSRHVAYALRTKPDDLIEKYSDDGEPSHTAGTPILHAIQGEELFEVAVAVVRYFGGIKLGKPGLIRAYKAAAVEALANSIKEEFVETDIVSLEFAYPQLSDVQKWMNREKLKPLVMEMGENVLMRIELPREHKEELLTPLRKDGRITFVEDD